MLENVGDRFCVLLVSFISANLLDVLRMSENDFSVGFENVVNRNPIFARWFHKGICEKEKFTERIDGAVATIMALDRAVRCGNDTSESVYNSRRLAII